MTGDLHEAKTLKRREMQIIAIAAISVNREQANKLRRE